MAVSFAPLVSIETTLSMNSGPARFVPNLPSHLHDSFFDGPSALAPGGRIEGSVWIFDARPEPFYEFRYNSQGGPGLGRISEDGFSMFAYPLR